MQATTTANLPPKVQHMLPELLQLNSAQRLSIIHILSTAMADTAALQQAIQTGLETQLVEDFDFDQHLVQLKN